ncbi:hypothetical protein EP47_09585 [Legionella norrlandica]|uniref:SidE PDE domain-containing protein n=1 Tax=Legionella norrlandica TaxID=1498499 RepID=A0A0A2SUR0_9GAMM|nr:SidE phosphodiesterase domain-containing protein [Legionella norrlandica]KGP63451.1 hypothetical protein EP47_09585 [Legionella norrlandica]
MKTFINRNRFLKAVEYVSENYFSKPYSITPMVGRWFNQLAMIQLENGKLIHLSGDVARKFVDITLDGKVVDPTDITRVHKFYAADSEFEKERVDLVDKIDQLTDALKKELEPLVIEQKNKELKELREKLIAFDSDKQKAKQLYDKLVARSHSSLNQERFEKAYGSQIKHIVYRPNHGLTHSVRTAYLITAIHAFKQAYKSEFKSLTDPELEKLQLMMLFSVVGRRDETGFNDTGPNVLGRATYESFRVTSGKEYLKYCRTNAKELYGGDLERLYRDAIIVELMGYSDIQDYLDRRATPSEIFIDYVIEKEHNKKREITREEALTLITKKIYTIELLFPAGSIRELADAKLNMMNKAHGLELTRCYPLYPEKEGGAKSIGILNSYLSQSGLYKTLNSLDLEKLTSVFKLIRCSFDALDLTGQNSMFGLISQETFEAQKETILNDLKNINLRFKPPISSENRTKLLKEARDATKEIDLFWTQRNHNEAQLLDAYRSLLLLKEIVKYFTAASKLNPSKKMFAFQHSETGNPHKVDHFMSAMSLINALQTITPVPGVTQTTLPIISRVKHDRAKNIATIFFDDIQQADYFKETYSILLGITPNVVTVNKGQFAIEVNRKNYQQLVKNRLVEFKQVTIPKTASREESLIDEDGLLEALNLITHNKALARLVSTTPLSGEDFPDYDYLLKALEDPIHERYTHLIKELENFPIEYLKYSDPRNGISYTRQLITEPLPELRFQEPITEPTPFSDKVADGLTVRFVPSSKTQRNTIYTKKLAHTLLPPHGKIKPYPGYKHKRNNYFPIGIISNIEQVDLKDERYVWAKICQAVPSFG